MTYTIGKLGPRRQVYKIKYGWYVTVSKKKVIEVGKAKKHTNSFKAHIVHFFCKRINLLTAVVPAVNLI